MSTERGADPGPERVREVPSEDPPALVHPAWKDSYPWLLQGTSLCGPPEAPLDLGLFSDASPAVAVLERWERLRRSLEVPSAVVARQVHGAAVRVARGGAPGLHVAEACDGHATDALGVLLCVTVADCVPVFVVDPERRAVAALHAGWRGVAAGVLEAGLGTMADRFGAPAQELLVHLGPSICGTCYEVGPEVFEALGRPVPSAAHPVDLRAVLAERAAAAGVPPTSISVSEHCTLHGDSGLFSHRGGDRGRQVGYIGVRA